MKINILLKQFVSKTPLKLFNRISWNFVIMKDKREDKYTTETVCQHISSETAQQNFM